MQPFDQKGDIDEESMKINLESAKLADDLLSNMLSQTHLINDDIYQVFIKKTQLDVIVQAQDILRKTQQFFDEQEGMEIGGGGQHQQLIQVNNYKP